MRFAAACLIAVAGCGSSTPTAAPDPGSAAACARPRDTTTFKCQGVDDGENMYAVTVCDGCATAADCTERPGGTCASVGGAMCDKAAAFICRYPGDICDGCGYCTHDNHGGPVCRTNPPPPPPAMDR